MEKYQPAEILFFSLNFQISPIRVYKIQKLIYLVNLFRVIVNDLSKIN